MTTIEATYSHFYTEIQGVRSFTKFLTNAITDLECDFGLYSHKVSRINRLSKDAFSRLKELYRKLFVVKDFLAQVTLGLHCMTNKVKGTEIEVSEKFRSFFLEYFRTLVSLQRRVFSLEKTFHNMKLSSKIKLRSGYFTRYLATIAPKSKRVSRKLAKRVRRLEKPQLNDIEPSYKPRLAILIVTMMSLYFLLEIIHFM